MIDMSDYEAFLERKKHIDGDHGFEPVFMPDSMFDFQAALVEWATRKGRAAIFADCGLGKTLMQLVWSENVVRHTGKPVLILTPLAVSGQTVIEAEKFGIEAFKCRDGNHGGKARIVVTNYERLAHFSPDDFAGVVCDESSILKNFKGSTKTAITGFMRKHKYRLLCTATASPNDYIELGTSSEALGNLGYMDMLGMFFKNDQGNSSTNRYCGKSAKFRFRGHAERDFWKWVCSWARAVRKPSDIGFDDTDFQLPKLITREHVVIAREKNPNYLFDMPVFSLEEQRDERKRTLTERCEKAAAILNESGASAVGWCHLNLESSTLASMIPDAIEVSGSDSDERKEEVFYAFQSGQARVIITKPTIAGFGLNWQHCHTQTFFPSHSFEQYYQAVRRSWRFGQKHDVTVDIITSEGEAGVLANMTRKAYAAEQMFTRLIEHMNEELALGRKGYGTNEVEMPSWL
jgi:hypothetical protein